MVAVVVFSSFQVHIRVDRESRLRFLTTQKSTLTTSSTETIWTLARRCFTVFRDANSTDHHTTAETATI